MKWRYSVTAPALKDLKRLDPPVAQRLIEALRELAREFEENRDQARLGHVRKLVGKNEYRLRVGDYRVRYNLEWQDAKSEKGQAEPEGVIVVLAVRHRRESYRD